MGITPGLLFSGMTGRAGAIPGGCVCPGTRVRLPWMTIRFPVPVKARDIARVAVPDRDRGSVGYSEGGVQAVAVSRAPTAGRGGGKEKARRMPGFC